MIHKILQAYKTNGISWLFRRIYNKIIPLKATTYKLYKHLFQNKEGFEIGGPSMIFTQKELLPIYEICGGLDNCNFSLETIWEGKISENNRIQYEKGRYYRKQFIRDSTCPDEIPESK